jgi:hypothetical protein
VIGVVLSLLVVLFIPLYSTRVIQGVTEEGRQQDMINLFYLRSNEFKLVIVLILYEGFSYF